MDVDKLTAEPADRSHAAPVNQEVGARESIPAVPHRSTEHSRGPSMHAGHGNGQERPGNDIWTSAISRLQAQVSYNTGMLDSHRRQFNDIEVAVGRLQQQMNEIVHALGEVQRDLRARPPVIEQRPRQDPGDLDVLATQLQRFTNRINEIDGLNMQVDLIKNRMKRLEDGAIPASGHHRPTTASLRELNPHHDGLRETSHAPQPQPPSQHQHPPQTQQQVQAQQQQQLQHAPLPPIRTNSMASPSNNLPSTFPASVMDAIRPGQDSRPFSGDQSAVQPPPASFFRAGETLPPPSALSSWRPAEAAQAPGASPANAIPGMRLNAADVEHHGVHHGPASAWAPVNPSQAIKRPPEDRSSPYDSPSADGSKRPRLAPLMPNAIPRSTYGEDGFIPAGPAFTSVAAPPSEVAFHPRSRAPSDGSQSQSQPGSTPAPLASQHNFRFITSTQQADSQDQWKADPERTSQSQTSGGSARNGRGKGSRGGRSRNKGRGGANGPGSHHDAQELGTPEYERPEFSANHMHSSGFYTMAPQSPRSAARDGLNSRSFYAGTSSDRQPDLPATPSAQVYDAQTGPPDAQGSGGKKTRTKPIRNAEGILIRKDGRPDMRSVSSANNLRKVHAKKEAERAGEAHSPGSETMMAAHDILEDGDGITRSGTPTSAAAGDMEGEGSEHGGEAQDKHKELLSQTFAPTDVDSRVHEQQRNLLPVKSDGASDDREGGQAVDDVDMQEPVQPKEDRRDEVSTDKAVGEEEPSEEQRSTAVTA